MLKSSSVLPCMKTNMYLPGDDLIDQAIAEFMGYFWCRYLTGQVVGERIVRFLMSPQQFEDTKIKYGPGSIGAATGTEQIEQLAYKPVPTYHSSRDAMADVEAKFVCLHMWDTYVMYLRNTMEMPPTGPLTAEQQRALITADARARSMAAYILIDSQRPKQQALPLA